jgi:hypothetical protein
MQGSASLFPGRETIASKLSALAEADQELLKHLMENASQDDALIEGLNLFLDNESNARFLNSLKLGKLGEWLGNEAPDRLQVRLMESARSSQHAVHSAFRDGLIKSGGLERAFPKANRL